MPYPYLPTFKDKRYDIGFDKVAERPKLEGVVGRCIALWSWVDNELGGLFGILLKTESDAAQRVFLVLRRSSYQRDALKAAAEGVLSGDEMATFEALMVEYRSLESQRNDLSHGCFGICPDDDDLLFMIKVEHHVIWQTDVLPKLVAGTTGPDPHQGLKEKLMVYRLEDLERLHAQMKQLWWDMFHFNGYLREPKTSGRVAEFRELFSTARIQQRINALKR
jgi:hypothetical protein